MPKDTIMTGEVLSADGQSNVMLPGEAFLQDSSMERDGHDLVLTLKSGETVIVEGYFDMAARPDLLSPQGGVLSPALVDSFLSPSHAGEYAQSAQTASDVSAAGQVTDTVGDVFITRADGTKLAAAKGMMIFQGDVVEADIDSAVNIVFADNSSFAVSEGARLSVDQYIYDSEQKSGSSFFSMLKGAFIYTSGMIGKSDPENVNIDTPVGSIGIRGTVVAGVINEAGQLSEITVIDGAVVVSNGADSYVLDEDFETLQLTGFDAPANNIGTVDADYMTQNYSFDTTVDGFSFYDYSTTPQEDGNDNPAPQNVPQDAAPTDGDQAPLDGNQEGAAQGTQTADAGTLSGDLLVQEMLQFQTYQQLQQQIGDEFIDQTGGAVLPADGGETFLSGTGYAAGTTTDTTDVLTDAGGSTTPTAPQGAPPPIVLTSSLWWDGSSMTGAGTVREFGNIGFQIGDLNVSAPAGGVSYAITGGNDGYTGLATFAINASGELSIISDLATYQQTNYTLTIDVTDADLNTLPVTLNINIDDLSTGRNYIQGSTGVDTPTVTAAADLIWADSGDDIFNLTGVEAGDVYLGGLGSDVFSLNGAGLSFTMIDGGYNTEGTVNLGNLSGLAGDAVLLGGSGIVNLDLSSGGSEYGKFKGIESFVFTSSLNHSITLDTAGVLYATNQSATTLNIWGADGSTAPVTPYTLTLEGFDDVGGGIYQSQSNAAVSVNVIETVSNEINVVLI